MAPYEIARAIVEGRYVDSMRAYEGFDTSAYQTVYKVPPATEADDAITPPSHAHSEAQEDCLLYLIESSPRYDGSDRQLDRIKTEFTFFQKTNNITFVLKAFELVEKMRNNGDVWGVGRGSSCASLILYIIGLTDVDPLKYNIDFVEFSKEYNDEEET